ncbi:MAG: hypothetical protein WCJ66_03765 [Verrucomicrobiota bacterium]
MDMRICIWKKIIFLIALADGSGSLRLSRAAALALTEMAPRGLWFEEFIV